jgi:hypothetical protein
VFVGVYLLTKIGRQDASKGEFERLDSAQMAEAERTSKQSSTNDGVEMTNNPAFEPNGTSGGRAGLNGTNQRLMATTIKSTDPDVPRKHDYSLDQLRFTSGCTGQAGRGGPPAPRGLGLPGRSRGAGWVRWGGGRKWQYGLLKQLPGIYVS